MNNNNILENKRLLFRINGASYVISHYYKAYLIRKKLKFLVMLNRHRLAMIIQKNVRKLLCMKLLKRMKKEAFELIKEQTYAAIKIQKIGRAYNARKLYNKLTKKKQLALKFKRAKKVSSLIDKVKIYII